MLQSTLWYCVKSKVINHPKWQAKLRKQKRRKWMHHRAKDNKKREISDLSTSAKRREK